MLDHQRSASFAARGALAALAEATEAAARRLRSDEARIVHVGCGTSTRIASQSDVERASSFSWPRERSLRPIGGGEAALTRSIEGAEDDGEAGASAIDAASIGERDVVLAVAASGSPPYAVEAARRGRGAPSCGFADNPVSALLDATEHSIALDAGADFLAGSNRMTAGIARKIALTLFSTQLMSMLGRARDG